MKQVLDFFETWFNRVTFFLASLVAVSIGLIAVLIPLNLLLIKMNWGSIWWLYEAVEYALYVGVFISAPWVLHKGAHVRVDLVTSALPPAISSNVEKIMDLVGFLICFMLFIYGVRIMIWEFEDGTLPDKDLRIANGYMMAVFAFSFLLLAFEFLMRFRRSQQVGLSASSDTGF